MSTSSTSQINGVSIHSTLPRLQEQSDFRFRDFVQSLSKELNCEGLGAKSFFIDKTNRAHPVLFTKGQGDSTQAALAIEKICALMQKNLGFLIKLNGKQIDEAIWSSCVGILKKCEDSASRLKLEEVSANVQRLLKKIDKVDEWVKNETPFFIYRYVGQERRLIACRISLKAPEAIVKSPQFWRRCLKAVSVEFSAVFNSRKGVMSPDLFQDSLSRRISFSSIDAKGGEHGKLFHLQTGFYLKEVLWQFILRHSHRLSDATEPRIDDLSQPHFLQVLEFLLFPKKYPVSWDSANSLWEGANKLGIAKVKAECLFWLKREMGSYKILPKARAWNTFSQALMWHRDVAESYPEELEAFFSQFMQSLRNVDEFTSAVNRLREQGTGPRKLVFTPSSGLTRAHYQTLSALTSLKALCFNLSDIDEEMLNTLESLQLTELEFDDLRNITLTGFRYLASITTLRELKIKKLPPHLSNASLWLLSRLPLSSLNLKGCSLLTDSGLATVQGRVTELVIDGSPRITSGILTGLATLGLKSLSLSEISTLSMEDLLSLKRFSNLTNLEIAEASPSKMTDLTLPALAAACKQLTKLRLENLRITDRGMIFLRDLSSLQDLTLCRLSVSSLNSVGQLTGLTHLGLLDCRLITERSLKPLGTLASLNSLRLAIEEKKDFRLSSILDLTQLTALRLEGEAFAYLQSINYFSDKTLKLRHVSVRPTKKVHVSLRPTNKANVFKIFHFFLGSEPRTEVLRHRSPPVPVIAKHSAFSAEENLKLALQVMNRIPLDDLKSLLEENSIQWLPKIKEELNARIGKKHHFVPEDFPKALDLMSWAIDAKSFDLVRLIWKLFFDGELHQYRIMLRGPSYSPELRGPIDIRLVCSVYKQSYASFLERTPSPCPLEVVRFLAQKIGATTKQKEIHSFLAECLKEYIRYFRPIQYEEEEELSSRLIEVALSYLERDEISTTCLTISNFLVRALYRKLLGYDIHMDVDDLRKQFRGMYRRFRFDILLSLDVLQEMVDLVFFTQQYELGEIEKIFSVWLLSCLASQEQLKHSQAFGEVLAIMRKAGLSHLTIHKAELVDYIPKINLDWWLEKLSQEGLKLTLV